MKFLHYLVILSLLAGCSGKRYGHLKKVKVKTKENPVWVRTNTIDSLPEFNVFITPYSSKTSVNNFKLKGPKQYKAKQKTLQQKVKNNNTKKLKPSVPLKTKPYKINNKVPVAPYITLLFLLILALVIFKPYSEENIKKREQEQKRKREKYNQENGKTRTKNSSGTGYVVVLVLLTLMGLWFFTIPLLVAHLMHENDEKKMNENPKREYEYLGSLASHRLKYGSIYFIFGFFGLLFVLSASFSFAIGIVATLLIPFILAALFAGTVILIASLFTKRGKKVLAKSNSKKVKLILIGLLILPTGLFLAFATFSLILALFVYVFFFPILIATYMLYVGLR